MADIVAAETAKFDVKVRPVTNEEIEFFFENGWVKLPALIDRDTAALLLERAKKLFGEDGRKGLEFEGPVKESWQSWFRSDPRLGQEERFTTLALSRELGRNAARLLGRDSSIRLMMTAVMAKLPGDSGKGSGTDFHQDTPGHMYLEANFLTAWIALDEVTPKMGAMQFYSGSHKLGNLGQVGALWDQWTPHIEHFCSLSEPVALQPGDATIHMNGTIHGTDPNLGDRPRWSWAGVLVPGDARYTGAKSEYVDGLGLEPYDQLDHPKFPIIYDPAQTADAPRG